MIVLQEGFFMMTEAFIITLLGMGSVFFFLFLLICVLNILRLTAGGTKSSELSRIAAAIAVAKHQE